MQNFHITLAFLGDISPQTQRKLVNAIGKIEHQKVEMMLDKTGYWPKQGIYFATASRESPQLNSLATRAKSLAGKAGVRTPKGLYLPHVTLARQCDDAPVALSHPEIQIEFPEFCLFESTRTPKGVRYDAIENFALN